MSIIKLLSYIFLFFVKTRNLLYFTGIFKSFKIENLKIISVGNLSFGGTGKTPITIKIAENLKRKGFKVAVLLRGYKRRSRKPLVVVHDGVNLLSDPTEAGDEAILIAKEITSPVVVSKDRVSAAKYIKDNFNPDFLILDDGFQHLRLRRDKDILIITQDELEKDIYLPPAGRFREPLSHAKRADTIVITKIYDYQKIYRKLISLQNKINRSIFLTDIVVKGFLDCKTGEILKNDFFKDKECIIFCGIGKPQYFEKVLLDTGLLIKKKFFFPDHYVLKDKDYKKIDSDTLPIITTSKDFVKIDTKNFRNNIFVLNIDYKFKIFSIFDKGVSG